MSSTALIMAGGTGGHIMPGLAVAHELAARGWRVKWLGNPNGMEAKLLANQPYEFLAVDFGGVRGKGLKTKLLLPFNLLRACVQSFQALAQHKPNVVLGMGGYITFPAGLMARLRGLPLVLHEQNAVAGMANKVLAKIATSVLSAFPNTLVGATWVGNPVRREIVELGKKSAQVPFLPRAVKKLNLLVVGGSLGAQALNQIVPQALALIPIENRPSVVHQAGAKMLETLQANYAAAGLEEGVQIRAFIDDMAAAYAQADLVICRSGAMTVSEIASAAKAALFVPFPFAVDDHQTANAEFLSLKNAAMLMQQRELSAEKLAEILQITTLKNCHEMGAKAYALSQPEAAQAVADVLESVKK